MPVAGNLTDQTLINALRCLSIDMVQAANSGHPGLPLGAAPMAYAIYARHLRFHPGQTDWFGRDRFILSAGHGSALLYSCLHLFGYDLPLEELRRFRQLGSKTPGHPEVGLTPGVECTTGPLGQGFATGIGMAVAQRWLWDRYGNVADFRIYGIVSDGDLMEGIAQEAASLAGHLKLGKIIYLYDSNDISLDGEASMAYSEDVAAKFESMGWHVQTVEDGNDLASINTAIEIAKDSDQPSLVIVRTTIGYASPLAGSAKSHGAPLGDENVAITKQQLGWELTEPFALPDGYEDLAVQARIRGEELVDEWQNRLAELRKRDSALADELELIANGELPEGWDSELNRLSWDAPIATRDSGSAALNAVANHVPWVVGGAADLASSTKTYIKNGGDYSSIRPDGRNVWFGVREHAMGAMVNGMALTGLRPFGSTFLVFSDYMRGAIRMAALTDLPCLFIFSHDSVFVGEDGPTHQPVEHVAALRLIPNLSVFRPADALETAECYRVAFEQGRSCALILTRQAVPNLGIDRNTIREGVAQGGYQIAGSASPAVCLVATGSEVALALEAQQALADQSVEAAVFSVPCRDIWTMENLPEDVPCVSIEAGVTQGWNFGNRKQAHVGIDRFGESAPGGEVYKHLGITVDQVVETSIKLIGS